MLCQVLPVERLQHFGAAKPLEALLHVGVEPLQGQGLQQPEDGTATDQSSDAGDRQPAGLLSWLSVQPEETCVRFPGSPMSFISVFEQQANAHTT